MFRKRKYFFISAILVLSLVLAAFQNCGSSKQSAFSEDDDGNGNNVALDTSGPKIIILSKPNSIVNNATAEFQLTVTDDRAGVDKIQYQFNDGEWVTINNILNLVDVPEGLHEVKFKATDKNNNSSSILSYKWRVDKTSPVVTLGANKPNLVSHLGQFVSVMPLKFITTDETSLVSHACTVNNVPLDCVDGLLNIPLAVGYFTAKMTASDVAGNSKSLSYSWQVTDAAGSILKPKFKSVPDPYNNKANVELYIQAPDLASMSPGSTFTCTFDGVAIPCVPNKTFTLTNVTERISSGVLIQHSFVARIDYKGKGISSDGINWVTDLQRPVVTVVTKPAAVIYDNRATFNFGVSDNSGASNVHLICVLDGLELDCPINQNIVLNSVASGDHVLRVYAEDKAGNGIASNIEILWNSPSCDGSELSLRWPMNGKEFINWGVLSYFDVNAEVGLKRDFGGVTGAAARANDNHFGIALYPGDHKKIYTYNSSNVKIGNATSAAIVAMEDGEVIAIVKNIDDRILDSAGIQVCRLSSVSSNYIRVRHENGFVSQYSFLNKNSVPAGIVVGTKIVRGQIIGYAGSGGCLSQPQLTVTLKNCANESVDPLRFFMKHEDGTDHIYRNTVSGVESARVMGLLAYNGRFTSSATHLNEIFNRTRLNTATRQLNRSTPATLSYFLGHVTDRVTEIRYAFIPPGKDGVVSDYVYSPSLSAAPIVINGSNGRLVRAEILNQLNRAGLWKVKIYHIRRGDVCTSRALLEANCAIGSIDVHVQ